jgi:hypothetical protein
MSSPTASPDTGQTVSSDFTIQQWCARRNYSLATFYKLKKTGHAPEIVYLPGASTPRITQRADLEWEKRMLRLAKQEPERREAERRRAQRVAAGKAAVARGNHVSTTRSRDLLPALDAPTHNAADARQTAPIPRMRVKPPSAA